MTREAKIRRYVQDTIGLLLGTAGFIQQVFLTEKPDLGLILLFFGMVVGVGANAGVQVRREATDGSGTASSSTPPSPSSSSPPSP